MPSNKAMSNVNKSQCRASPSTSEPLMTEPRCAPQSGSDVALLGGASRRATEGELTQATFDQYQAAPSTSVLPPQYDVNGAIISGGESNLRSPAPLTPTEPASNVTGDANGDAEPAYEEFRNRQLESPWMKEFNRARMTQLHRGSNAVRLARPHNN